MGVDARDDLAVEFQHQAQHAVGGWMLRTEVDVELADVGFSHRCGFPLALEGRDARFRCLGGKAGGDLVPGHDHALVAALADRVDAVVGLAP